MYTKEIIIFLLLMNSPSITDMCTMIRASGAVYDNRLYLVISGRVELAPVVWTGDGVL
jgi:hypothetical protein